MNTAFTPVLQPCPFCGSANVQLVPTEGGAGFYVICGGCDAEGPARHNDGFAVKAWNRRRPVLDGDVVIAIKAFHDYLQSGPRMLDINAMRAALEAVRKGQIP